MGVSRRGKWEYPTPQSSQMVEYMSLQLRNKAFFYLKPKKLIRLYLHNKLQLARVLFSASYTDTCCFFLFLSVLFFIYGSFCLAQTGRLLLFELAGDTFLAPTPALQKIHGGASLWRGTLLILSRPPAQGKFVLLWWYELQICSASYKFLRVFF